MLTAPTWVVGLLIAAATSFLLTTLVRRYALERGVIDSPGARSSHSVPTPTGGGLALVVVLVVGLILIAAQQSWSSVLLALAAGVTGMGGLGWWDDHRPLSARLRFCAQLAICAGLLVSLGGVGPTVFGVMSVNPVVWSMVALVAMIWLTNLVNFMDGSDGLAAIEMIFGFGALALMFILREAWVPALVSTVGLAVVLGFLPWNLPAPQAKIFMGDVGSAAMGSLLAFLCVWGTHHQIPIQLSLMALSVFVVDATATLLMRMAKGQRWYTAHRQHAYQRLVRNGCSHARVLAIYALLNLLLVAPALWLAWQRPAWLNGLLGLLVLVLLSGWVGVQHQLNDERLSRKT